MRYRPLFLASSAVALTLVAVVWWLLPSGRIPVHFTVSGEPDGWGTRTGLMAFLTGTVVVLAVLLGWLAARAPTLSWELVNMPRKDFWRRPENEARARARLQEDLYLVGSWTLLLVGGIAPVVLRAVRNAEGSGSAGALDLVVVLGACVLLVVAVVWRQRWYRRVPDET